MKKIFTLIAMAFAAMSVNAQDLPENVYPIKDITWGDITWKNGNNKKDKDNNDMFFLMGTGNGYEKIYCEYFISEDSGNEVSRPYYTYIDYENGETGIPGYGLYYKFTPSADGTLKVNVWINKGNRKTFVVKVSDGKPLTPYEDYTFDGYINGQNTNTDQPRIDEETGQQAVDNQGNPVWIQAPTYFTAEQIKARVDEENQKRAEHKDGDGNPAPEDPLNKYVIDLGNQAVWGWITLNVKAGESYVIYQQTSQLGFGGFEFGGQTYASSPEGKPAAEFAAVIDENGKATNVNEKGSVVTFTAAGITVEAVGAAVPTEVTPDLGTAINTIKANDNTNAPAYNLAGQRVDAAYKGLVIKGGVKNIQK